MVVGVVGGMGSFATVDFFRRLIDAFPADKEWERPRMIIDNYCTMPSRVRAVLYNERREELICDLCSSVENLINVGATHIILACNTSHIFLKEIENRVIQSRGKFVHIINALGIELQQKCVSKAYLLASEGTIQSNIYAEHFESMGIHLIKPTEYQFKILRIWIEAVKHNNITEEVKEEFITFITQCGCSNIILGCTELPILYHTILNQIKSFNINIYDPLDSVINVLREQYQIERMKK